MDDAGIVQLFLDRNEQAIPETARKYGNYCAAIAMNILGNAEDTEECVNDTYLKTWNAIPPHRPKMLRTFLGKIVRNVAFDRYKQSHAAKRGGKETPLVLDELNECIAGSDTVEQALETQELAGILNEFLATLPKKKRQLFVCRYWYTDSVADIAARFGMTVPAVAMTLTRLRASLRKYLGERGYHV